MANYDPAVSFLTYQTTNLLLKEAIKSLPALRTDWLRNLVVPSFELEDSLLVPVDRENALRKIRANFANPRAAVDHMKLGGFGTEYYPFAYAKVAWGEDDFDQLFQRDFGEQFNPMVDPTSRQRARLVKKAAAAEESVQNLMEYVVAQMLVYGGYDTESEWHEKITYDFGRTVITTDTDLVAEAYVPSVNLTTSAVTWNGASLLPVLPTNGGFTAGDRAWSAANLTAGDCTPYADVVKMVETARYYGSGTPQAIHMDNTAYALFSQDVETNYPEAASRTTDTLLRNALLGGIQLKSADGLTFRRSFNFGDGIAIDIYTYVGQLQDVDTGVLGNIIPEGFVVIIPPSSNFVRYHGRIKHKLAGYRAMARYISKFTDSRTAEDSYDMHTSFLIFPRQANAMVTWKVR